MLSSADREVCARDPVLPGLELIFDADAMAGALGLSSITPAYLRYKPGVSCTAAFLHSDAGAFAVHAYSRDRYATLRHRPEWLNEPSVMFFDTACSVVVPARLDRKLRALRRFLDPDRRRKYLNRVTGKKETLTKGDIKLLRYKPGRRLVARIDRKGAARAALKITGAEDFDQALIGATAAAAHGGAPLLGASSGYRAFVTGWVPGRSICPEALGRAPERADVLEAGKALASLHADSFRPAAVILPRDDAQALATVADDLAALDRGLSERTHRIGTEIASRLREVAYLPALVHGDYSADQVVITPDRPVIIDWDHAACGDPARDIGSFLARLDAQVADGILTRPEADDLGAALVVGHGCGTTQVTESITLHHARALLLLVSEGFRKRSPDWPARGHALVDRAAALIATPPRTCRDDRMPQLDQALDPGRMQPLISHLLGGNPTPVLPTVRPELLRHKPGRRALVRYAVNSANTLHVLGKVRAKSPDRRTPRVHNALHGAGLDGGAPHGVGVPRAMGRSDDLHIWFQEELPGNSLARYLVPDDPGQSDVFERTGAALARLHTIPPATDRRWSLDDEVAVLDRALDKAARDMPKCRAALQAICRGAHAHLERLDEGPGCGIHRDFYFDQVLVDGPRIWLLDLDLYAIGDPAIDIANFLAHLDEFGLRRFHRADAFHPLAAAFLAGYATIRKLPVADRIETLRAVSLARHIHISRRFKDRQHLARRLISTSIATLACREAPAP